MLAGELLSPSVEDAGHTGGAGGGVSWNDMVLTDPRRLLLGAERAGEGCLCSSEREASGRLAYVSGGGGRGGTDQYRSCKHHGEAGSEVCRSLMSLEGRQRLMQKSHYFPAAVVSK